MTMFLCGWHTRAGANSVMFRLNVPHEIAAKIVNIVALSCIGAYDKREESSGFQWKVLGKGINVDVHHDIVEWVLPPGVRQRCGSSCEGRVAWLEPSLQQMARPSRRVCWGFEVLRFKSGACQEGIGAIASPLGYLCILDFYFPITNPGFCWNMYPFTSFGLDMPNGQCCRDANRLPSKKVERAFKVVAGDQFSFMLVFEPNFKRGSVQIFRNLAPLFSIDEVNTALPLFPAIQMCCKANKYRFIRNPALPPSIS